jgi:hypothetical protein
MASSDDYESLPESMHPAIHMAAGALAGIGEHCIMYPVDVVKVDLIFFLNRNNLKNSLCIDRLGCNVLILIPMQTIEE